jgi:predicted Zn-dependent protease
MGREGAREVEKEHKLVTDLKVVERVQRIGERIAQAANSEEVSASYGGSEVYRFDYKFKVIEDDGVNAFSLPGGIVYVNTGLLDHVQSDHELAGVLAHEVAHSAHHHMSYLLKEQSKLDNRLALLLLAGMLTKMEARDLGNLLVGAQLVRIATGSGYGQKAEADADSCAVDYVAAAGYNPSGILTFMERLAHEHARKPSINMGILQTHPAPRDRCRAVSDRIRSLGLLINRRAVTEALRAETESAVIKGRPIVQVKLGDQVLFEPAPVSEAVSSEQRATAIATKVNQFLDCEPSIRDITVDKDGVTVLARGDPILVVTSHDSGMYGLSAQEVAEQAASVLRKVIWQEMMARTY